MDIELIGLTPLQQDLAEKIWALDTQDAVEEFVNGLPRSLRRQAQVVMEMMIAAAFDEETDTGLAQEVLAQFTK
jgi:hypothetical protein